MKKTLSIFVTISILIAPVFVLAQTPEYQIDPRLYTPSDSTLAPIPINSTLNAPSGGPSNAAVDAYVKNLKAGTSGTQGSGATGGVTSNGASAGSGNIAQAGGSCYIGSMLSNNVRKFVSGLVGGGNITEVPNADNQLRSKETGSLAMGGLSWDGIGFCLVNTIIEYIGASTVKWINSGFNGNPVFIDDPEQFFSDIADIEAGNFLGELTGGFLCSSIQAPVRINLAAAYNNRNNPFANRARCSFTGIAGNMDQFLAGDSFSWQDWMSYTQNPYNNQLGATIYGQWELDQRIARAVGLESKKADWGDGFLSYTDPETQKIYSPGALVEEQLNKQLDNPRQRLLVADEFDEIVTALVNQFIKIALSEITQGSSNNRGSNNSYNYNYNLNNNPTNQVNVLISQYLDVDSNGADVITSSINWTNVGSSYTTGSICSADLSANVGAQQCFYSSASSYIETDVKNVVSKIRQFANNQGDSTLGISANGTVSSVIIEYSDGQKFHTFVDNFGGISSLSDVVYKLFNQSNEIVSASVQENNVAPYLRRVYLFHTYNTSVRDYSCGLYSLSEGEKIIKIPSVLNLVQSAILETRLVKDTDKSVEVENYVVNKNGEIYEYDLSKFSDLYYDIEDLINKNQLTESKIKDLVEANAVDKAICIENAQVDQTNQNLLRYIKSIRDTGGYILFTEKFN